jgi:hypothetical protein
LKPKAASSWLFTHRKINHNQEKLLEKYSRFVYYFIHKKGGIYEKIHQAKNIPHRQRYRKNAQVSR